MYCTEMEDPYWRMLRRLDAPVQPLPPPDGTVLRRLDVDADATALHALDALSFSANADYEPETLAQFRAEHLGQHDRDAGARPGGGAGPPRGRSAGGGGGNGRGGGSRKEGEERGATLRAFQTSSHGHRWAHSRVMNG